MRRSVLRGCDYMGRDEVAGYLLAGGKNRRMGGEKKAFLHIGGRPLWKWNTEVLKTLGRTYISVENVSAYGAGTPYDFEEYRLIEDLYPNTGPLGGILSGLCVSGEEALLVVTCDMTGCTAEMIGELCGRYANERRPVFFRDGEELLPFPGIYTREMIPEMKDRLAEQNFRMMDFLHAQEKSLSIVEWQGLGSVLGNINTRKEYEEIQNDNNRGSNHTVSEADQGD